MAHCNGDPTSLASSGTPRWSLGIRQHEHNHTSSGSLAQTHPLDMADHSAVLASRRCRCRIRPLGYTLLRWSSGRWRYILGPRFPQSRGWNTSVLASPLCRSRFHQWVNSRQSSGRNTPGSSFYRRCHFYTDPHSVCPCTRGHTDTGLRRYHTPPRSHTDMVPGSLDRRSHERRFHYSTDRPIQAGTCTRLSLGDSLVCVCPDRGRSAHSACHIFHVDTSCPCSVDH